MWRMLSQTLPVLDAQAGADQTHLTVQHVEKPESSLPERRNQPPTIVMR